MGNIYLYRYVYVKATSPADQQRLRSLGTDRDAGGLVRYHFGPFKLDLASRELLSEAGSVDLEPRTFDVLAHLIANRGRVVLKTELLDEVWGDRFVSETALTTQIKYARSAIGDDGRTQAIIKTVHRVGYRFIAPVTEETVAAPHRSRRAGNAPRWTGRGAFVGRDPDLDAVEASLGVHRLVTIIGPGGVGKTTLAELAVERLAGAYPDGVWVCELADAGTHLSVGNLLLGAVGEGQHSDADPEESLIRSLEERNALLVLDNCEHVVESVRPLAARLLGRCPGVTILSTSRAALGVSGESLHVLEPLALSDAIECFAANVARAGGEIDLEDPALGELCLRLDCLPLALELAAVHARVLAPSQIVELVSDRFRLLRQGAEDSAPRHSSLHAAIAWSWDMLDDVDRGVLARLTVLVGVFDLDAAGAIALPGADPLDVVDALGRLVSLSLVVPVPSALGDTRFRLLESIRDFAARRLSDAATSRRRHAEHFAHRAEVLDDAFQTPAIDEAIGSMRSIWSNVRAAVGYARGLGDVETLRRLIRATGPYADVFQMYEVLDWCALAELDSLPDASGPVELGADALAIQARMLAHRGHHEEATAAATRALQMAETHATLLSVLWCAYYSGALEVVVDYAHRLLPHCRTDRGFDRGFADGFDAIAKAVRQEPGTSSMAVSPGDADGGILGTHDCLVEGLRLWTVDPARAVTLLEAVVDSSIRNDYRLHLGAAASTLTQIALPGQPAIDSVRTLRRTLQMYLDRSMWVLISADTVMAAKLLADHDEPEIAARLIGARNASGYAVGLSEALRSLLQAELEVRLGDRFVEVAEQGTRWRPPEAGRAAVDALDRLLERLEKSPA